jgi:circadian clock protein KaiA
VSRQLRCYPLTSPNALYPSLSICIFILQDTLADTIYQALAPAIDSTSPESGYLINTVGSIQEFQTLLKQQHHQLDCLILSHSIELPKTIQWLHDQAIFLPALIIHEAVDETASAAMPPETLPSTALLPNTPPLQDSFAYHTAEVKIGAAQLSTLKPTIDRAIAQFINLSPSCQLPIPDHPVENDSSPPPQNFLLLKQRRLSEKLTERLGYLGVYYKRNPQNFLRNLPPEEKQETIDKFREDYREIVLCYFTNDGTLNQRIDDFVNVVFFTDLAVAQIVEIHMELMDEFSNHLKIEGRSEEILLDYRLTLIDVIAHLCEMYRRSVPKESQMEI